MRAVENAELSADGLGGDHGRAGTRVVTLLQQEHLAVVAALLGNNAIDPADLRRNILISGLNIAAARGSVLRIGPTFVRLTGICPPCSCMEAAVGHGGYNALRGHSGFTGEVLKGGRVTRADSVRPG